MKLLFLFSLVFLFGTVHAQSNRWMYLAKAKDMTVFVDTLASDTKQLSNYNLHSNVVLIWVKEIKIIKESAETTAIHFAIDTTNNQYEIISSTTYHNDDTVQSNNNEYHSWQDTVPESIGEAYISYCRALHNPKLMRNILYNAGLM